MPVPKLVVTAALMAAQIGLGMLRKVEGPRLDELDVSLADYGNPLPRFWGKRRIDGCPIIWAEKLKEKKKSSKGKGGKYAEYRYFGTFAVAVADNEIDAVSRIWLDKHLCYDATGSGPITPGGSTILNGDTSRVVKLTSGRNMRIYLGTETQEPDPRIEAWTEDRYGADSCPAYRGVAYIVFQDIPLEKFGNRIPQVTVEAISSKTDAFPVDAVATDLTAMHVAHFSKDFSRLFFLADPGVDEMQVWDVATRTHLFTVPSPDEGSAERVGVKDDGSFYMTQGGNMLLVQPDGGWTTVASGAASGAAYAGGLIFDYHAVNGAQQVVGDEMVALDFGFTVSHFFEDSDGNPVALGYITGQNKLGIATYEGFTWNETIIDTATDGEAFGLDNGSGEFVVWQDDVLLLIDKATRTVTTSTAASMSSTGEVEKSFTYWPSGNSIWLFDREHSVVDTSLIREIDLTDWTGGGLIQTLYDPVNHALIQLNAGNVVWKYLDRVGNAGVTLADIVDDVSEWVGLSSVDSADLDQSVDGYSVTQGSGKDMLAPLLDIHDSDARPHDFSVQFIKRGDASGGTLLTADFVRDGDNPRYTVSIAQDTDLPRKLTVNFADDAKDQQTNTVISQRPLDAVDSEREQVIDLTTYVLDHGDAQKLADRYFRRAWNGRERIEVSLTAQNLALEPGDVRTLSLDGVTRDARLLKMTLAGGALKTEWERDFQGLATLGSGAGAEMEGRDEETIFIPAPTKGFVLDIPLLTDSDSSTNPLLYYGAGKYAGSWPGAVIYEVDGDDLADWNAVASADGATWGYSTDALGDALSTVWDRGSSVNVKIFSGTLSSVTEAQIDADPTLNMAYLGGEILNFATATLESDGTYTLSGFKRGRRGTEWATDDHAANDEFVLVSSLAAEGMGASDIGTSLSFKAQTTGRDPEGAPAIPVSFTGASLKPYAPARVKASFDGTDWAFTITRRTRVGGAWVGGTSIPLSENSEAYEIDILDGDGDVVRTLELSATNTVTWTNAMQVTDFGSTQTTKPDLLAYQLSDAVDRGFALAA